MSGVLGMVAGAGGLGGIVDLPATMSPNDALPGGTSNATLLVSSNGSYAPSNDAGGNYVTPTTLADRLEARLTQTSGFPLGGATLSAWLALTAPRTWSLTSTAGTSRTATATLEIREAATGLVLDSCTVTFTADSI